MEKGESNGRSSTTTTTTTTTTISSRLAEADLLLKWGNKKRLRCVRVRDQRDNKVSSFSTFGRVRRKIFPRFLTFSDKDTSFLHQSTRPTRNSEAAILRSKNRKSSAVVSPEKHKYNQMKEEKCRQENGVAFVWPKLFISLSNKEKEEDFMAMKGCRLPQRPKKRAKIVQRTLLLVSPGAWLSDMCQERYEVREKKTSKKKGRGLKAMGSMESDSD